MRERGTALMMVPATLLVVLGLTAVAVDGAVVLATQRRLASVCASAADDAAGMLDGRALHTAGTLRLDPVAAARVGRARTAPARLPGPAVGVVTVRADAAAGTVDVRAAVRVPRLVLRRVPGGFGDVVVRCASRGRLRA